MSESPDIIRLHERIDKLEGKLFDKLDKLSNEVNAQNTRFAQHLGRQEGIGVPGLATTCKLHSDQLADIDAKVTHIEKDMDRKVSEGMKSLDERLGVLEKAKIKLDGFRAGSAATWGLLGAIILFLVQTLWTFLRSKLGL